MLGSFHQVLYLSILVGWCIQSDQRNTLPPIKKVKQRMSWNILNNSFVLFTLTCFDLCFAFFLILLIASCFATKMFVIKNYTNEQNENCWWACLIFLQFHNSVMASVYIKWQMLISYRWKYFTSLFFRATWLCFLMF